MGNSSRLAVYNADLNGILRLSYGLQFGVFGVSKRCLHANVSKGRAASYPAESCA
jgi:hypothetical protein